MRNTCKLGLEKKKTSERGWREFPWRGFIISKAFIFNNRYVLYLFSIHFGGRVIFRRATDDGRKSIVKERDLARIREKQME